MLTHYLRAPPLERCAVVLGGHFTDLRGAFGLGIAIVTHAAQGEQWHTEHEHQRGQQCCLVQHPHRQAHPVFESLVPVRATVLSKVTRRNRIREDGMRLDDRRKARPRHRVGVLVGVVHARELPVRCLHLGDVRARIDAKGLVRIEWRRFAGTRTQDPI